MPLDLGMHLPCDLQGSGAVQQQGSATLYVQSHAEVTVTGVLQGASGVSVPETPTGSIPVPNMSLSVHDSVNTVGSAAISKAIQQAQAQAQAHGMGSQVTSQACKVLCDPVRNEDALRQWPWTWLGLRKPHALACFVDERPYVEVASCIPIRQAGSKAVCDAQLARLNARLQQQGLSLAELQRPAAKRPSAPAADPRGAQALSSSAAPRNAPLQSLPQVPSRCLPSLEALSSRLTGLHPQRFCL